MISIPNTQPFKWLGGKKWLNESINFHFNIVLSSMKHKEKIVYIEPFCGGLGSFIAILPLLLKYNVSKIVLNDINSAIITTFISIKNKKEALIKEYEILELEFSQYISLKAQYLHVTKDKFKLKFELKEAENYFKKRKEEFNFLKKEPTKDSIRYAALFLFLLQHSFNGIYRENLKGEFNTPYNWDNKIVNIHTKIAKIEMYHTLFNAIDIEFKNKDVFELLSEYKNDNCVLYLDPPYINEDEKENNYNKDSFNKEKQIKLLNILNEFSSFLYSNHLLPLFEEYFTKENHSYDVVHRKNIMTGKAENRGKVFKEILGTKIG